MTVIMILQRIIVIFRLKRRLVGILQRQGRLSQHFYQTTVNRGTKIKSHSNVNDFKHDISKLVEDNKSDFQNARSGNSDGNNDNNDDDDKENEERVVASDQRKDKAIKNNWTLLGLRAMKINNDDEEIDNILDMSKLDLCDSIKVADFDGDLELIYCSNISILFLRILLDQSKTKLKF